MLRKEKLDNDENFPRVTERQRNKEKNWQIFFFSRNNANQRTMCLKHRNWGVGEKALPTNPGTLLTPRPKPNKANKKAFSKL